MTSGTQTETDLLAATARRLSEQGYDVIVEPSRSLLPDGLEGFRADAVAIGRKPKLVVEIASGRANDAQRVAELQRALRTEPDWALHLVLNRASKLDEPVRVTEAEIAPVLARAIDIARIDSRAALLTMWAALEAWGRERMPTAFARPQSPERIIEHLAARGIVGSSDAAFLRSMARSRNAFVHGDLRQTVATSDIDRFVELLQALTISPALRTELGANVD